MTRQEIKFEDIKLQIINCAFEVWGKTGFIKTPLSSISKKLKLTKPAIYRHFKDKKTLLKDMNNLVINNFTQVSQEFLDEKYTTLETLIHNFIYKKFKYFCLNLYHFYFFLYYVVKNDYFKNPDIEILMKNENQIFSKILEENQTWLTPGESQKAIDFIFSTGIYILIHNYRKHFETSSLNFNSFKQDEIKLILEKIYQISLNGLRDSELIDINFQSVEDSSKLVPEDLPKRDELFDAVSTVVTREGLWETSIAKIADELNLNKNNLYFYFVGKSELLIKMIKSETNTILSLAENKLKAYNSFEEKFYSFILVLYNYFITDKRLIYVFDWLYFQITQFKNFKNFKSKIFSVPEPLVKLLESGKLKSKENDPEFLYFFLSLQIIKDIFINDLKNKSFEIKDMRYVYNFYLKGFISKT